MEILVNSVYTGGYGYDEGNLSHEVINFFAADNHNYYVYITPYGTFKKNYDFHNLDSILFVQNAGNKLVQVLALAKLDQNSISFVAGLGEETALKNSETYEEYSKRIKKEKERYDSLVDQENITYGGVSLHDIHKNNTRDNFVYVSLKVEGIYLPKKTFYLTLDKEASKLREDVIYLDDESQKIANQSMKKYFDEKLNKKSYQTLKKLIDNKEYWQDKSKTLKYHDNIKNNLNFFKITREQNNEHMYTAMFYYLFNKYPDVLVEFINKILNINLNKEKLIITMEKNYIDLAIYDQKYYIIIENKIKSSINGVTNKKVNGQICSQLSTYYEDVKEKFPTSVTIKGLIFMPNYNIIKLDKYYRYEKYQVVYYQDIYNFLKKAFEKEVDLYILDFIKALEKHTKSIDSELRDNLLERLNSRIKKS